MKLCCVFNYNPHYRLPIYKAIDEEFKADFFFGDTVFQPLAQFDPNILKGFKGYINASRSWLKGFISYNNTKGIFNNEYTHYIITGSNAMIINWKILIYSKLTGKKVYIWCHGEHAFIKKRWLRIFQRTFYNLAEGLLIYHEYSSSYMIELGCNPQKLYYIHNSLDTNLQTTIYNEIRESSIYQDYFKNDYPTLIYIGRIQKVKKIDQIISAMNILKDEGVLLNLIIVGSNVDYPDFEDSLKRSSLNKNIWIYGPCYDEAKNAELLYNAHALVSPGNVGLSCIHSLSYGTPVITNNNLCTQMPEHGAIRDGITGSFFVEDNLNDLAEKIKYWCSKTRFERGQIRSKARLTIENYWSVNYQINLLKTLFK